MQENVRSVDKQYKNAWDELSMLDAADQRDGGGNENLPLTEIREELDEDGNIICTQQIPGRGFN